MGIKKRIKGYYIDIVKGKRKRVLDVPFSFLLLLLSFVYGFFVKLILSCYQTRIFRSYKAQCQLISVGNITWGGTGKTPMVQGLIEFFLSQGQHPAILIRGYGRDEVYMLKNRFPDVPVLEGRKRIKTARDAVKRFSVDTIILDDGFQHWPLLRDLDIVLIDVTSPFGNRRLIPRGILREPLSSLSRADIFILTKSKFAPEKIKPIRDELRKYNFWAPIYEADYRVTFLYDLNSQKKEEIFKIKNARVAILAGIADCDSFARTVSDLGSEICLRFYFPDHYRYKELDLKQIERRCRENNVSMVLTTEKDAIKLTPLLNSQRYKLDVLAVGIELKIAEEEKFFDFILEKKEHKKACAILILSDAKAGHLNQSKAVAQIIQKRKRDSGTDENKLTTTITEVKFKNTFLRFLLSVCSAFSSAHSSGCLACLRFCLRNESFTNLMRSPADIIVSAGSSLSAVNLFLSYRKKARRIAIMKPALTQLSKFDLVIVPEHDRLKKRENILVIKIAPNLIDKNFIEKQANILKNRFNILQDKYARSGPTIGVLIGGNTSTFTMTPEVIEKIIRQLKACARNLGCQILVTTSRRTPKTVENLLQDTLTDFTQCKLLVIANEKNIPQAVGGILGLSDIVLVSGESISMVSEAISAQRYVLTFIPEKNTKTRTKQENFLYKLQEQGILKIVFADMLEEEIKRLWQEKPKKFKLTDKELIYHAVGKIV